MPAFTYRFTGPIEEDFPEPPIARRLQPGEVIEVPTEIVHARLEMVPDKPAKKTAAAPASTDKEE